MHRHNRRLSIWNLRPLQVVAALSGCACVIWLFTAPAFLVAYTCLLQSVLVGLTLQLGLTVKSYRNPTLLQVLIDVAQDRDISQLHAAIAEALRELTQQADPIFRQLAISRLQSVSKDCNLLGEGVIEFVSTESWRVVYEELLRSPGLHLYRSVAYIETAHYWQDGPGQQSTQLNLELHDAGVVTIERTAIVADHLWPESELFPVEPLHTWLDQQHRYGIWVRLVRESSLENDTDLLTDLGIYGSRGVGFQTADPAGRTIRFRLDFNFERVQEAERKWNRLGVYSTSYSDLLGKQH